MIVDVPRDRPVATPWVPEALEIVAVDVFDEVQTTCVVRSCVVPSV